MTRSGACRSAIITISLAVSLTTTGAQPPSPPPPGGPQATFRTEANFVRVDVYPTRDGVPVEDLTAADFEVLEDNRAQKIETFEHVRVAPAGAQTSRIEPNTVRDSQAMAADPRARVFVLFLDTYHVSVDGSHNIRGPLIRMLDQLIGQDDLVGVMTPEMSAASLTFARKTTTIEGMLTREWIWGRRESRIKDKEEDEYEICFPYPHPAPECREVYKGVAEEMIYRRRAKRSIDALVDLAVHLRGVREERMAILTFSNGWIQYRPNERLARLVPKECGGRIPQAPGIFVDPQGRLGTRDERNPEAAYQSGCERDRVILSQLDISQDFRDLLDVANRSNVTFYPIDPRGLAAFDSGIDTGISTGVPPPPTVDQVNLRNRLESLRTLAENTDGLAIVDSNNLDAGLKRITADLSSYYLLGYYSSNPKLDGSYRRISVRVKRPDISVRSRRGYKAATASEVSTARAAAAPAAPRTDPVFAEALSDLGTIRREARLRLMAVPSGDHSSVWVVGEIDGAHAASLTSSGAEALISVMQTGGGEVLTGTAEIERGRRSFVARLDAHALAPGGYSIRARVAQPDAIPAVETVYLEIGAKPRTLGAPMLQRRGGFASLPFEPAADKRFRRNQTLRVQVPLSAAASDARMTLRDRSGKAIGIPVTAREVEADGARWLSGDITLAPLAVGEYLVDVEAAGERVVIAFAIVT